MTAAARIGQADDGARTRGQESQSAHWFDYDRAFSRNIGWLTEWEQQKLRRSKIAIAGMGGVGGIHMLTLARMGVGRFSIADFDSFELENFNRQMGASARTLGQHKAHAVLMLAQEINPEIAADMFDQGLNEANLEAFLDDVDVYIDGLDFFVLDIRRKLFALARRKGIPAVTAAPIGMGSGYLVFTPDSMSFEDYFGFGDDDTENYVRFLLGLTPAMLHRSYLADPSRVDLLGKRGPSTAIACQMCASVAAAEALKLILNRGPVKPAPWFHHFDAYRGKHVTRKLPFGVDGPLVGLKRRAIQQLVRIYSARSRPAEDAVPAEATLIERIIEAARWAPSPDNSQPWRFAVQASDHVCMTIDLEIDNPYQYQGSLPNWLSAGMMLEALRMAAAQFGHRLTWTRSGCRFDIRIAPAAVAADPLAGYLRVRSVDRGRYSLRPLTETDRTALEAALGPGFSISWQTSLAARMRYAGMAARSTLLRMRSHRCYDVHRAVITRTARFSEDGLPIGALGLNPLSRWLLGWGLESWQRMRTLVRWLRADLLGGLEMDLLPGLWSGGYAIIARQGTAGIRPEDHLIAGGRLLRFWLEACARGLAMQPALGPLFVQAVGKDVSLQVDHGPSDARYASSIHAELEKLTGMDSAQIIFAARLGHRARAACSARSLRRPVTELVVRKP